MITVCLYIHAGRCLPDMRIVSILWSVQFHVQFTIVWIGMWNKHWNARILLIICMHAILPSENEVMLVPEVFVLIFSPETKLTCDNKLKFIFCSAPFGLDEDILTPCEYGKWFIQTQCLECILIDYWNIYQSRNLPNPQAHALSKIPPCNDHWTMLQLLKLIVSVASRYAYTEECCDNHHKAFTMTGNRETSASFP